MLLCRISRYTQTHNLPVCSVTGETRLIHADKAYAYTTLNLYNRPTHTAYMNWWLLATNDDIIIIPSPSLYCWKLDYKNVYRKCRCIRFPIVVVLYIPPQRFYSGIGAIKIKQTHIQIYYTYKVSIHIPRHLRFKWNVLPWENHYILK